MTDEIVQGLGDEQLTIEEYRSSRIGAEEHKAWAFTSRYGSGCYWDLDRSRNQM